MHQRFRIFAAGAALAVLAVIPLYALGVVAFGLVESAALGAVIGIVGAVAALGASFFVLNAAGKAVAWVGRDSIVVLGATVASLLLLREFVVGWPSILVPGLLVVVVVGPFLVGSGAAMFLMRPNRLAQRLGPLVAVAGAGCLAWGVGWALSSGSDPFPRSPLAQPDPVEEVRLDPADRGTYRVSSFTYGSGSDERRPEFGSDANITTSPVDLSVVLPEWRGFRATHREWWWGFGIDEAPRNGRVELPEVEAGDRRPIALIVHGNHRMDDFSDEGYAYLTRLLASHGIVAISVDANFLNGTWSGDFGGREMPARAILLLEHLRQLREWSRNPRSVFYNRLDFDRVALLGHSRGGEAAAIATAFNDLARFPDDAGFEFDYGFGIEAVVAIAQIDRRYSRRIELENVHFLALQGSYDTDEPSFHGLRQFHRIRFRPPGAGDARAPRALPFWIKAGLVAHGANHGQFNSTWGMDSGYPGRFWLNRAPLMSSADQRMIAAVYISAFLRATLLGEEQFVPLLQDYRSGRRHLPETLYQSQYRDSFTTSLADFEEDLDVHTASIPGSMLEIRGFAGWGEEEILFRDGSKQGASAVRLEIGGAGTTDPVVELRLAEGLAPRADSALVLSLAWNPRPPDPAPDGEWPRPPLTMTARLLFSGGAEGPELPVASVRSPEPPVAVRFLKSRRLNRQRYRRDIEWIPQTVLIPWARLTPAAALIADPPVPELIAGAAPRRFAPGGPSVEVVGLRFRFDRSVAGEVLLDDIALRRIPPGES